MQNTGDPQLGLTGLLGGGSVDSDYLRFRGKCQSLCKAAIDADSTLRLVRGHYYCPIWNSREPHWWTVRIDGAIHDPSKYQFPSRGNGTYEEFDGMFECSECGKRVSEDKADIEGNYVFCSYECHGRFVGVM
jgi:hypothetical protein